MMAVTDVPSTLRDILQTYGRVVVEEPKRTEGLLRDLCPTHVCEVNLLWLAHRENIPAEMISHTNSGPRELLLAHLKKRLKDNYRMTDDGAAWAVDAWDFALGFCADAVSFLAAQAKSDAEVKPDAAPPAITPQKKAVAKAALLALCTELNGKFDLVKSRASTAEQIQRLLNRGADVNAKDTDGCTTLMLVASSGRSDCLQVLLSGGADVNAKNKYGSTALMKAASYGHPGCLQVLISGGADVNAIGARGFTALMEAAEQGRADCMEVLLAYHADIDAKDKNGWTALMWAVRKQHSGCVTMLLSRGADVNAENNDGRTALNWATYRRNTDCMKLLKAAGAKR